ncbi:MAG: DUF4160 domain-containing protein [Vulcanimicrobiaceae bacterium]
MPSVVIGGFTIRIYTRDERGHRPHVHAFSGGGEVVLELSDPVAVRKARGMKLSEVRRALNGRCRKPGSVAGSLGALSWLMPRLIAKRNIEQLRSVGPKTLVDRQHWRQLNSTS